MPGNRQPILTLLEDYGRRYPGEQDTCRRIVEFVREHEDCFERTQLLGHITGSAWVLDADRKRTLLTHHRKLDRWLQPGGHADGDHDVAAVALKEAEEETGLKDLALERDAIFDIDVHMIPERGNEPAHYHYDCRFVIIATGDDAYTISEESHDLAWVPLNEIEDYTDEWSVLRMAQKTLA